MNDELIRLRQRVQELEKIALEHTRLKHLVEYAAQGNNLSLYMALSVVYVDPISRRIMDANDAATELLGYSHAEFLRMSINELEQSTKQPLGPARPDEQNPIEAMTYPAVYQHSSGHQLPVTVHRRVVQRNNRRMIYYRLEDTSLHRRLWYELQRREDDGFKFQQKLTLLNEITLELSRIESLDALYYHVVKLGMERLGFDRLSLWLVDTEHGVMRGTYGVDEDGDIRSEHGQHWSYAGTQVYEFIAHMRDTAIVFSESPIYNEKSEIIRYGWQVTVPVRHGNICIATLAADNFLRNRPFNSDEPELLRLYGITIANLIELLRSREQAIAMRLAAERTQALREFMSNIGHEFKTPITVILTNAYLFQHYKDEEKRQSLIAKIVQQGYHLNTLVDDTLEFIALHRESKFEFEPIPLALLIEVMVQEHRSMAENKKLQVDVVIEGKPVVRANPRRIRRALSNIFLNALEYTPENGSIRVVSSTYPNEGAIRIQDSGIGIDQETLKYIFDVFYRGDSARTERHSGLGLPIARQIIDGHGGRIVVESEVGKGSTFEVILPLWQST